MKLFLLLAAAAALLASASATCADNRACNVGEEEECFLPPEHYKCDQSCVEDADDNGVCDPLEVTGCSDKTACNYNPMADKVDDSLCEYGKADETCDGVARSCPEGYVPDCSGSGACCPTKWIGDGIPDCGDKAYGCDLRCHRVSAVLLSTDPRYDEENDGAEIILDESADCADYDGPSIGCDGKEAIYGEPLQIDNCGVCGGDNSCACAHGFLGKCEVFLYFKDVTQQRATVAYKSSRKFYGYQFVFSGPAIDQVVKLSSSPLANDDDGVSCNAESGICVGFSYDGNAFEAGEGDLFQIVFGIVDTDNTFIDMTNVKATTENAYIAEVGSSGSVIPLYAAKATVEKATLDSFSVIVEMTSHSPREEGNTDIDSFGFKMNGVQLVGQLSLGGSPVACQLQTGKLYECSSSSVPSGHLLELEAQYVEGEGQSVEITDLIVIPTTEFSVPTYIEESDAAFQLPQVTLMLRDPTTDGVEVRYKSFVEITGYQFRTRGIALKAVESLDDHFSLTMGVNTGVIIAFSMSGSVLPKGTDMALLSIVFDLTRHATGPSTMLLIQPIFTAINAENEDDYVIVTDPRISPGQLVIPNCDEDEDGWCDNVDYDGDGCVASEDSDPTTPGGCPLCGDADGDGRVTVRDLVRIVSQIMQYDGVLENQPKARWAYGDVNADGKLTVLDIVWIVGAIVRLVDPRIEHPNCVLPMN